jgi:ABC-type Fe3+-citrate transport system substrate-binding protein
MKIKHKPKKSIAAVATEEEVMMVLIWDEDIYSTRTMQQPAVWKEYNAANNYEYV